MTFTTEYGRTASMTFRVVLVDSFAGNPENAPKFYSPMSNLTVQVQSFLNYVLPAINDVTGSPTIGISIAYYSVNNKTYSLTLPEFIYFNSTNRLIVVYPTDNS